MSNCRSKRKAIAASPVGKRDTDLLNARGVRRSERGGYNYFTTRS